MSGRPDISQAELDLFLNDCFQRADKLGWPEAVKGVRERTGVNIPEAQRIVLCHEGW